MKDELELESMVSAWHKRATEYKLGKPPLMVFLEEDGKISKSFMYVNSFKYEFTSPIQAIDVTFKAFFSLQLAYPKEAVSSYMVLQKRIYHIDSESDIAIPSVYSFLSELRQTKLA